MYKTSEEGLFEWHRGCHELDCEEEPCGVENEDSSSDRAKGVS